MNTSPDLTPYGPGVDLSVLVLTMLALRELRQESSGWASLVSSWPLMSSVTFTLCGDDVIVPQPHLHVTPHPHITPSLHATVHPTLTPTQIPHLQPHASLLAVHGANRRIRPVPRPHDHNRHFSIMPMAAGL